MGIAICESPSIKAHRALMVFCQEAGFEFQQSKPFTIVKNVSVSELERIQIYASARAIQVTYSVNLLLPLIEKTLLDE